MTEQALVLRPDRRRTTILFWTGLGATAVLVSVLSLAHPVIRLKGQAVQLGPWTWPGVLGLLLVLHMQLVYATLLRLVVDGRGIAFRNLLGTRRLAWTDISAIDSISALTLAGRGGNMSGLRLRTRGGDVTIPDVFTMRRDALRTLLLMRSDAARG